MALSKVSMALYSCIKHVHDNAESSQYHLLTRQWYLGCLVADCIMVLIMWTPASGTKELTEHFGRDRALELLTCLLAGEIATDKLVLAPYAEVIRCIGNANAETFFQGESGVRHAYWPRVWAARALAYLGDDDATPWLQGALSDAHWRVRMTAAQTLGRLGIEGYEDALIERLSDEHPRVRAAAATALGRTGNEFAIDPLQTTLEDEAEDVRERADRALARVEKRVEKSE